MAEENYTVQNLDFSRDGQKIAGKLYLPKDMSELALVIMSHGFGANWSKTQPYAEFFANHGLAAYIFDFIGGGLNIQSDGTTTEMSVLTEAADLEAILTGFEINSRFESIFLFGESQGGFVSTYVAAKHPKDIAGLILLYPAFVLQDDARKRTPNLKEIPEIQDVMGIPIGKRYTLDALSFDIYDTMKQYPGPVLIIHGTADPIVPLSYAQRAAQTFLRAHLETIAQAGHGFSGKDLNEAARWSLGFIDKILEFNKESLHLAIDDTEVSVNWHDNKATQALKALANKGPLTLSMSKYGGFEQVGNIGQTLPSQEESITTRPGDIVLYNHDQLVIFYGSNTWEYTPLGTIVEPSGVKLTQLLDRKETTITLFLR